LYPLSLLFVLILSTPSFSILIIFCDSFTSRSVVFCSTALSVTLTFLCHGQVDVVNGLQLLAAKPVITHLVDLSARGYVRKQMVGVLFVPRYLILPQASEDQRPDRRTQPRRPLPLKSAWHRCRPSKSEKRKRAVSEFTQVGYLFEPGCSFACFACPSRLVSLRTYMILHAWTR
jgi:hypothetical protein